MVSFSIILLLLYILTPILLMINAVVMSQINAMAEDLQPLLADVCDSGLFKEVENLTRSLTQASDDLRLIWKPLLLLFYL